MGYQPQKLEKLFDKWAVKHAKKISTEAPYELPHEAPYGKFVRDGIVNPEKWSIQEPKICFVMPEAGGYDDNEKFPQGHDLAAEWNVKGCFTELMFKIAVWVQAVNDAFFDPVSYVKKSILNQKNDLIRAIAIVNLQKSDGQKVPQYKIVNNFVKEDATEIRKEIELINPDVILCCNTFRSMRGQRPEDDTPEKPKRKRSAVFYSDELTKGSKSAYRWNDKLIMDFWHVMQFQYPLTMNNIHYYSVREFVRAGIASLGPFEWAEL